MHGGVVFARGRTAGLLVLLCLVCLGQWCAANAEFRQHDARDHCCLLCHIGPHASLDAVTPAPSVPVLSTLSGVPVAAAPPLRETSLSTCCSRAPPRARP